jgi:mono/diheme cytochrome c family protein
MCASGEEVTAGRLVAQSGTKSVLDGVFSSAQADRGQAIYRDECASCHLDTLGGADRAAALTGDAFQTEWDGLTVGDLFERIRLSMPQDSPMSLSRQAYIDVVAYILKVNGFPTGRQELETDPATLKAIKLVKRAYRE